ncbi:hypothetical protein GCM10009839_22430 [Catenulispora yoronensis]|uniref:Anti-sigma factor antagonist n=1 Tax=Catenulispora yoronensis TaxID=450799 RepID=A0ABN2TY64_9ACTN
MAGSPLGEKDYFIQRSRTLTRTSPDSLRISVHTVPGGPVIALAGELDISTAPALRAVCLDTFDTYGRPHAVVDVAGLSFCDCAGLSAFLHVHKRALANGGWIRLCGTDPRLRKVLAVTGLGSTLRCYPTAADAFADVEPGSTEHTEQGYS